MKKNYKLLFMGSLTILLFVLFFLEKPYSLTGSEFIVSGTSTTKDWKIISTNSIGEGEFEIINNSIQKIYSLTIRIPLESLRIENPEMNTKVYFFLQTEKDRYITFILNNIKKIENKNGTSFITAKGNLSIAGVTKLIEVKAKGVIEKEQVLFQGVHSLKMTDFDIDPPTAVLGAIRADDKITVTFKVLFNPKASIYESIYFIDFNNMLIVSTIVLKLIVISPSAG